MHWYNQLTGEFMGKMKQLVNSWVNELTGEFLGTMI